MRLFFSIIIFTAFALRPAIQVSTVLYYQLNVDTIIEKYCVNKERPQLNCNGKCYLMNQLKVTNNSSSDTDTTDNFAIIAEAFIPVFFQHTIVIINNSDPTLFRLKQHWKPDYLLLQAISKEIEYPPENYFS
ncbi:hypothetical protein [Aquimarina addita]|uniref:hypothetical protein n=1 Tax=Aquimarina addita TaxID=870485 RepID=UPI0031E5126C